jgi:hypothetical protein
MSSPSLQPKYDPGDDILQFGPAFSRVTVPCKVVARAWNWVDDDWLYFIRKPESGNPFSSYTSSAILEAWWSLDNLGAEERVWCYCGCDILKIHSPSLFAREVAQVEINIIKEIWNRK